MSHLSVACIQCILLYLFLWSKIWKIADKTKYYKIFIENRPQKCPQKLHYYPPPPLAWISFIYLLFTKTVALYLLYLYHKPVYVRSRPAALFGKCLVFLPGIICGFKRPMISYNSVFLCHRNCRIGTLKKSIASITGEFEYIVKKV